MSSPWTKKHDEQDLAQEILDDSKEAVKIYLASRSGPKHHRETVCKAFKPGHEDIIEDVGWKVLEIFQQVENSKGLKLHFKFRRNNSLTAARWGFMEVSKPLTGPKLMDLIEAITEKAEAQNMQDDSIRDLWIEILTATVVHCLEEYQRVVDDRDEEDKNNDSEWLIVHLCMEYYTVL